MKPSILEYIGTIENGVLVLISILYNEKYYEGTFYYTDKDILLTISEELEKNLGHKITEDKDYVSILKDILKRIVPFNEIKNTLDPVDFNKFIS